MTDTISREELRKELESGHNVCLVEALPLHSWEQGHLPGAVALPPDRVRELASHRIPAKDAAVIVYSESARCGNARRVADELRSMGYSNVRCYDGGKEDWVDSGMMLEGGGPEGLHPAHPMPAGAAPRR